MKLVNTNLDYSVDMSGEISDDLVDIHDGVGAIVFWTLDMLHGFTNDGIDDENS